MKKYKFKGSLVPSVLRRDWDEDRGDYRIVKSIYPDKTIFVLLVRGWMSKLFDTPFFVIPPRRFAKPYCNQIHNRNPGDPIGISLIEDFDMTKASHKDAIRLLKQDLSIMYQLRANGIKKFDQDQDLARFFIETGYGRDVVKEFFDRPAIETVVFGDFKPVEKKHKSPEPMSSGIKGYRPKEIPCRSIVHHIFLRF